MKKISCLLGILFLAGCGSNVMNHPDEGMMTLDNANQENYVISSIPPATLEPQISMKSKAIQHQTPIITKVLHQKKLSLGSPVFIRIFKESNELEVWVQGQNKYDLAETFHICDYSGNLGPKIREGDKQSPEGFYKVRMRDLNPNSKFHLSFDLGYPNVYDRRKGRTGSHLMVHGGCLSEGCYAMGDGNIEKIYTYVYSALAKGQKYIPVHVFPFRMTWDNLALNQNSGWYNFWKDLKVGYDAFENTQIPPKIAVINGRYQTGTFYTMSDYKRYLRKPVIKKKPKTSVKIRKTSLKKTIDITDEQKQEAVQDLKETVTDLANGMKSSFFDFIGSKAPDNSNDSLELVQNIQHKHTNSEGLATNTPPHQ